MISMLFSTCLEGSMSFSSLPIMMLRLILLSLLILLPSTRGQVPGLVYTYSGYDNIDGYDAICWGAPSFHLDEDTSDHHHADEDGIENREHVSAAELLADHFNGRNWKNDLIPSFVAGPTEMLSGCPTGTNLNVDLVAESTLGSDRLRTERVYTYHVTAEIDLAIIRGYYGLSDDSFFVSSDGVGKVSLKLVFCPVNGNLCSPFVIEQVLDELDSHMHNSGDDHNDESHGDKHNENAVDENHDEDHNDDQLRRSLSNIFDENLDGSGDEEEGDHHGDDGDHERQESDDDENRRYEDDQGSVLPKAKASSVIFVKVEDSSESKFQVHMDIDIAVDEPGDYLPLATLQLFLGNTTIHDHENDSSEIAAIKFDIANLLRQRSVTYDAPIEILEVEASIKIFVFALIAVADIVQLVLLGLSVYYRSTSVMHLSQGHFLILLQISGVLATTSSFLFLPKNDNFCLLQTPMVFIPIQLMLAIVYGRLRRIVRVMEPLMNWRQPQTRKELRASLQTWNRTTRRMSVGGLSADSSNIGSDSDGNNEQPPRRSRSIIRTRKRAAIRQKFTASQLWVYILLMTAPMVIAEVVGLIYFSAHLELQLNEVESAGRYECGNSDDQWYQLAILIVPIVTLFLTLHEASRSRHLPALFNEANEIASGLLTSLFIACLGFTVVIVSDDPTLSPGIPFLMEVVIVLGITLNISVRLVLPKLRLIWKGEKVVVSSIMAEHRSSVATKQSFTPPERRPTPLTPSLSSMDCGRMSNVLKHLKSQMLDSTSPSSQGGEDSLDFEDESISLDGTASLRGARRISLISDSDTRRTSLISDQGPRSFLNSIDSTSTLNDAESGRARRVPNITPIQVVDGIAPPSRLTLSIVEHTEIISRMNERILSGLQVNRSDWNGLKASVDALNKMLDRVEHKER